jgi:hypothetical protein
MSKRLLTVLLFISLFLNAGIVGGLVVMGIYRHNHISHHYMQDQDRPAFAGRNRFLPPEEDDPNIVALRDSFRNTKIELMQELAKDPINEARIDSIIDESIQAQSNMETALGHKLLEIRKSMTPEEAKRHFSGRLDFMQRSEERRQDRRTNQ